MLVGMFVCLSWGVVVGVLCYLVRSIFTPAPQRRDELVEPQRHGVAGLQPPALGVEDQVGVEQGEPVLSEKSNVLL